MRTIFKYALLCCMLIGATTIGGAQSITFRGCPYLFEQEDYFFTSDTQDGTGRNIYITTPVTGDQDCGGLGTCEFRMEWSPANSRWEFLADAGDGDLVDPLLIYYNTSASMPNPPGLTLGSWVENVAVTEGVCNGILTTTNAIMTGDVQSTLLQNPEHVALRFGVFPNPAHDIISVHPADAWRTVSIYNELGQEMRQIAPNRPQIDISKLAVGVYMMQIEAMDGTTAVTKFVKI